MGLVTTDSLDGKTMEDYAMDESADLELGDSDMLLLIDTDTEQWYLAYGNDMASYVDNDLSILFKENLGSLFTCLLYTSILEELVGEIWDEHDEIEVFIRKTGANTFLVDAGMDFDEFAAYFQLKTDSEMTSVSGWVMEQFGRVPESGERITAGPLDVLVTKVDNHRIEEIQITQHAPAEALASSVT